jgi:hypothetical protein
MKDGHDAIQHDGDPGAFPFGERRPEPFEHGLDVGPPDVRPDRVGENGLQNVLLLAHAADGIVT